MYLQEVRLDILTQCTVSVSRGTISKALKKAGITRKMVETRLIAATQKD